MENARNDWIDLYHRLAEGERLALLELSRIVTAFLRRGRAHDFESDWDDLIQEVLITTVVAIREERVRDPAALGGFVRTVTRNKWNDRLRVHLRAGPGGALSWDEVHLEAVARDADASDFERSTTVSERDLDMRRQLDRLPPPTGEIVMRVKGHGRTCEQVSGDLDIPLGTVKRKLAEGLKRLRALYEANG